MSNAYVPYTLYQNKICEDNSGANLGNLPTDWNKDPNLTWSITGWAKPEDNDNTDGYRVTAFLNWPTATPNAAGLSGICVEYLDENNRPMKQADTAAGAPALCHLVHTTGTTTLTVTGNYAVALNTLSWTEWMGGWNAPETQLNTMASDGKPGTAVSATNYGVMFAPSNAGTGTYTIGTTFRVFY